MNKFNCDLCGKIINNPNQYNINTHIEACKEKKKKELSKKAINNNNNKKLTLFGFTSIKYQGKLLFKLN